MSGFDVERYSRQTRFARVGADGQEKLAAATVAVVGCGALGGAVAMALARAGVGRLRLVDRDVPELSNLPRQLLFDEADVTAGLPKAVAAARHPWVHGGAIGAEGRVMAIVPGRTACLRCLVPEPPAVGALPTCDTAGIIGPAALVVGAVEAAQAIRLIVGSPVGDRLLVCDLWTDAWRTVDLAPLAATGCPTCRGKDYPWLEGRVGPRLATLCGRDAVQVLPAAGVAIDLESLATRLAAVGAVTANAWMVRARCLPIFPMASAVTARLSV